MNRVKLLGAAGLAASLMAAPAFAQNSGATNAAGNGNLNNPSSYSNGGSYGNTGGGNNSGSSNNPASVVGNGRYANVGMGGYTATQDYIRNGNNGNNNNNANNGNNNNWRPSQRNHDLADNGDARASKVIGTSVYNTNNQKLGNVNDVLIGQNGVFAVIKTNNKQVAVPFNELQFGDAQNQGNDRVVLPNKTQAQLNTQPVFHYNETNYQGVNGTNGGGGNNGGIFGNNNNNNGWHGNGGGPFSGNGGNNGGGNNGNNNRG